MPYDHNNEELIKRTVAEFMDIKDPKEADKWEKYLIYVMLN